MMSLNRYRLKHLVKENDKGAIRADKLLKRPDRLLGVILIGNNFVNILAASLTTVLCLNLFGDSGVVIGSIVLTLRERTGVKRQSVAEQLSRSSKIDLVDVKSNEGIDV